MEHQLAQRRLLVCAAFFSFGTLCGALILFNLSEVSVSRIIVLSCGFLGNNTALIIPAAFMVFPLLLILSGVSAIGKVWITIIDFIAGCTSGFLSSLTVRYSNELFFPAAVFLIYALCLLVVSVNMAGISERIHTLLRCGGLVFPDYRYFAARVECAVSVLLLEATIITYYLLRL